ncbi:MAG: aspartate aminotransferase family protein [Clostridia bacterium]|nr:aspartate aminotransferase family protein [Clostridia bacterium]
MAWRRGEEEVPSVAAEELLRLMERHLNPGMARLFRFLGMNVVEAEAEGAVVYDSEGRTYIDCSSGFAVANMGHRHPRIVAAVEAQLHRLPVSLRTFVNEPAVRLAERLAQVSPGRLQYAFFCNSGAEAVEAALKLARLATGRLEVVAAHGAFHGKTLGALSATGNPAYRGPLEPLLGHVRHVPFGDAGALAAAVSDATAAVILEPIQGEGGVIVPPEGYLAAARDVCDRHGALLILDEVQTGMGRTGRLFACQHEGVAPDLMTLGKGLGGGVLPLAAALGTPEVFAVFDANPLAHSSTLGGNPLACAAGLAALAVCEDEDLPGQAAERGAYLLKRLRALADAYPTVVREVRGRGLLIGVQLTSEAAGGLLVAELLQRGVLTVPGLNDLSVVRFAPPLNIPWPLLEQAAEAAAEGLAAVAAAVSEL